MIKILADLTSLRVLYFKRYCQIVPIQIMDRNNPEKKKERKDQTHIAVSALTSSTCGLRFANISEVAALYR